MAGDKKRPPDLGLLLLNTATVRERWSLREMIRGCMRHGIRGISPWRDKLAQLGAKEAAKLIRDHGLKVTGLCRGGMMGDGVIDLPLIRSWMETAGYRGFHEAEIFSAKNWWKREPDDVLGVVKRRHQECC